MLKFVKSIRMQCIWNWNRLFNLLFYLNKAIAFNGHMKTKWIVLIPESQSKGNRCQPFNKIYWNRPKFKISKNCLYFVFEWQIIILLFSIGNSRDMRQYHQHISLYIPHAYELDQINCITHSCHLVSAWVHFSTVTEFNKIK